MPTLREVWQHQLQAYAARGVKLTVAKYFGDAPAKRRAGLQVTAVLYPYLGPYIDPYLGPYITPPPRDAQATVVLYPYLGHYIDPYLGPYITPPPRDARACR